MSSISSLEWFEILEPKTKKCVFVNTISGKSQWNPPDKFEKLTDNQWWELYDFQSCNYYYYNNQTKQKTWVKPNSVNFVSLVKLQIVKERKKKTFLDQTTQTSVEDLHIDHNRSNISIDNIESSGYSTYNSNNIHNNNLKKIPEPPLNGDYMEFSSTLPSNRKVLPRTNPNYTRHISTLRLSQVSMGVFGDDNVDNINSDIILSTDSLKNRSLDSIDNHVYASSVSVDESINFESASTMSMSITKSPVDTFENHSFPRNSVINAIERGISVNTEIWTRSLFNKSGSQLAGIMSWTSKSIPDSLLAATPKAYKKKACENFKQIQMYMGDRESRISKELLALTICRRGISSAAWANEIFMQLCKQVTYNPNNEKTFYGWELICISLMFFHPESVEMKSCFKSFLEQYACFNRQLDMSMLGGQDFNSKSIFCARMSLKLLEMSHKVIEITVDDVLKAKKSYASSTIFYSSLNEVMDIQKPSYPHFRLPWIQVALTREILRCDGARTQGILRIPSEIYKIEALYEAIEKAFKPDSFIDVNTLRISDGCDPLLNKILSDLEFEHDPLLLSSVLKYWLRHLRDPLIPFKDEDESLAIVSKDYTKILQKVTILPEINRLVLKYLIYFLQVLAKPDNVVFTNMPSENLVTLMAPTLFKLDFNQLQPAMHLLQSLILNMDTSDMESMS